MTMIDPTPAPEVTAEQMKINYLEQTVQSLRGMVDTHRQAVRNLYVQINDHISDNNLSIEDDIPLASLDEYLSNAFTHELSFTKMFEVQITFTVDAVLNVEAATESEAREKADMVGLHDIDIDTDGDVVDWALDYSRINYVGVAE